VDAKVNDRAIRTTPETRDFLAVDTDGNHVCHALIESVIRIANHQNGLACKVIQCLCSNERFPSP